MSKRNLILSSAVAALVAAGMVAKSLPAHAEGTEAGDAAKAAPAEGKKEGCHGKKKDGCKGKKAHHKKGSKDGCGGKDGCKSKDAPAEKKEGAAQ